MLLYMPFAVWLATAIFCLSVFTEETVSFTFVSYVPSFSFAFFNALMVSSSPEASAALMAVSRALSTSAEDGAFTFSVFTPSRLSLMDFAVCASLAFCVAIVSPICLIPASTFAAPALSFLALPLSPASPFAPFTLEFSASVPSFN